MVVVASSGAAPPDRYQVIGPAMKDLTSQVHQPDRQSRISDRIMKKIVRRRGNLDTPCWLWTGSCSNGYGQLSISNAGVRRMIYVHRWLYEHDIGPIPPGCVVHHQCETPNCVNPIHLEPVTQRQNMREFTSKKTLCKHGHPLSGENLVVTPQGVRKCRECSRRQQRRLGALGRGATDRTPSQHARHRAGTPVMDRIEAKTEKRSGPLDTQCWIWMGSLCGPGYGQIRVTENGQSKRVLVHRWMYERRFGPPPPRAVVHHLCDTPRCVNPEHLMAVTHGENTRATTDRITHCKHGHRLDGDNVMVTRDGRRICRACRYRRVRQRVQQLDLARKSLLYEC